ncbi:NUDIX domain-containing protein [Patescibacteria group bacterium]|nr:NUDIX domain-containing protein [Patescibacteria group bacterium]
MDKRNLSVTTECFVKKGDKWLMLHRGKHKRIMPDVWMGPGGHIEFNEGLFEAARREVREETGLEIGNLKIKAVGTAFLKDLDQELFFNFVTADYKSGKLKQNPDDGELVWLTLKEIMKKKTLLAELRKVLPYVLDSTDRVVSYKAIYKKGNKMTKFILEDSK